MDFRRLFDDYRVPYSLKVNKGWINANCPWCDVHIDSFNLGFNPKDDYCTCWKCGAHGLYEALGRLLNCSAREARSITRDYEGRSALADMLNNKTSRAVKLELPGGDFTVGERKYLEKRGFNPDFLREKYGVCGGGVAGEWKYRIIIPLVYKGRLVSWTARSILGREQIKALQIPRYKNLSVEKSVIDPKHVLFNLDNCNGSSVILTEGAMDVMRGGDDVCCSFGTSVTETQIGILVERFRKVFILFDNEHEAQDKARKYGAKLSALGVDVEVVDAFSDYGRNDMGDCTEAEVLEIKKELLT